MAQFIKRFYGKKRGDRNMRSDKLGGASLAIFFAACFIAGCVALGILMVNVTLPDWRTNLDFRETTCQVLDTRVSTSRQSRLAGNDPQAAPERHRPEARVQYRVDGKAYDQWVYDLGRWTAEQREAAEAALTPFQPDHSYPLWYDPVDPSQAVIVQGHNWFAWLVLALPLSFIALGGSGVVLTLVNWDKSAERRSAMALRASRLDPFEQEASRAAYPNVPRQKHLTDSPGTTLAYRLPAQSGQWKLWGLVIGAVTWNGIVAIMLVLAIRGHMGGRADWALTGVVTPFLLVGLLLLFTAARSALTTMSLGTTIIEIDLHPLHVGHEFEVFVRQRALRPLRWMEVWLVCEEEARYQQGTNLRSEVCRVHQERLYRDESVVAERGVPREARLSCTLPPSAMHSFASAHNRITWKLLVVGEAASHAQLHRSTAVSVYPMRVPQRVPA